jgi:hypothetical protein
VGKGEHFPVFAQQNGGSAAGRLKADCPYIHGRKAKGSAGSRPSLCSPVGNRERRSRGNCSRSVFRERLCTGRRRIKMLNYRVKELSARAGENLALYSKACDFAVFPKSRYFVPLVPTPCSRSPVALYPISRPVFPMSRQAFLMSRQAFLMSRQWGAGGRGISETGQKTGPRQGEGREKTSGIGTLGTPRPPDAAASGVISGVQVAGEAVKAPLIIVRHTAGVVGEPSIVFALDGVNIEPGKIPPD